MQLVNKTRDKEGCWEVAWTWLPHFIATNPDVIDFVNAGLSELFVDKDATEELQKDMHAAVIGLILKKFPMPGLREYLIMVTGVRPEESLDS